MTYVVDLTYVDTVTVEVNHTNCAASSCLATFEVLSSEVNLEYNITLSARNDIGSSSAVQYPYVIGNFISA